MGDFTEANKEFIEGVRQLKRQEVIKSDYEIAVKTGVSKGLISKYLNGKDKTSSSFMQKFREAFNMEHIKINGDGGNKENKYDVYNVRLKHDRNGKVVLPADLKPEDVEIVIEYLKLMLKSMK